MSVAAQILAPADSGLGGQYSQYFTLSYELSSFPRFYTHAAMISV